MPNDLLERPDLQQDQDQNPLSDEQRQLSDKLDAQFNGPLATESGSAKIEQDKLKALGEKSSTSDKSGNESEAGDNPGWFSGGGKKKNGWWSKKKAASVAGIVASVFGISSFFLAPLIGPLEFIHFSQTLQTPHLGAQEDASDTRLMRLFRGLRAGSVGETRINALESKYYGRMTADLAKAGISVQTGPFEYYKGLSFDTTSKKSPYRGMTPEALQQKLEGKYGKGTTEIKNGKVSLAAGNSYFKNRAIIGDTVKLMGYKGVGAFMSTRGTLKRGQISISPLKKLDRRINESVANKLAPKIDAKFEAWKAARTARIKTGVKVAVVSTSGARDSDTPDKDGKPKPAGGAGTVDGEATKSKTRTVMKEIANSKTAKVTGGVAAVGMVVCLFKSVNDNIGAIRYEQVVLPLMSQGMDIVAAGEQVQSGMNFNDTQLEYYSRLLNGKDANGKPTDWSQAESIRANEGGSGGVPLDQKTQTLLANNDVPLFSWTENSSVSGLIGGMCSELGTYALGGVSIVLGVVSGGVVSTLAGFLASYVLIGKAVDAVSDIFAGDAVDVGVVGPQLGAQADVGVKLYADYAAMRQGGEELSAQQTAELDSVTKELDLANFSQEPLATRLFDVSDRRSLAGKAFDLSPKTTGEFTSNIATLFSSTFLVLGRSIGSLSPQSSAQSLQYSYYGLPKFGFSVAELEDEKYGNPRESAEAAAKLFNSPDGQKYIDKAFDCYGVGISKTADGWGATLTDDAYRKQFTGERADSDCKDRTDENWMRTRFFIFDTSVMEGYACLQGDSQSCINSGFGDDPAAAADSTGSVGTIPTGTTKELAQKILDSPNISFQADRESYFKSVATTGGQQACGHFVAINPKLLGVILALSEKYKIVLGVFAAQHGCGSDHEKGLAVDINGVNPLSGSGGTGNFLSNSQSPKSYSMPIVSSFYVDLAKTLSANGGGKINQYHCFGKAGVQAPNVSSITGVYTGYPDSCDHLHMAVKE